MSSLSSSSTSSENVRESEAMTPNLSLVEEQKMPLLEQLRSSLGEETDKVINVWFK